MATAVAAGPGLQHGPGVRNAQASSGGVHGLLLEDVILEPGPPDHARVLTLRVERSGHTQQLAIDLNPRATPA